MNFAAKHADYIKTCEKAVADAAGSFLKEGSKVSEAAKYSLVGGGKYIRGVLVLAVCDMLGGNMQAAQKLAAAIEMMHTFSLIHDDLPCLDNDDLRRGKPACHIAFGEGTALLAGDLLAITSLQAAASAGLLHGDGAKAVGILASSSGANGMIYGQELDIKHEKVPAGEAQLYEIHKYKTGALIKAAAQLGALCAGVQHVQDFAISEYAENIGLVFQIVDDILDVTADEAALGKPVGSDKESGKTTFVSLFGVETARKKARALTKSAAENIEKAYAEKAWFLSSFAKELALRVK